MGNVWKKPGCSCQTNPRDCICDLLPVLRHMYLKCGYQWSLLMMTVLDCYTLQKFMKPAIRKNYCKQSSPHYFVVRALPKSMMFNERSVTHNAWTTQNVLMRKDKSFPLKIGNICLRESSDYSHAGLMNPDDPKIQTPGQLDDWRWIFQPIQYGIQSAILRPPITYTDFICCVLTWTLPLQLLANMSADEFLPHVLAHFTLDERNMIMQDERMRVKSFQTNWTPTEANLSGSIMARAGLYNLDHHGTVQCAFCSQRFHLWSPLASPMTEHARRSPNCPVVRRIMARTAVFYDKHPINELQLITLRDTSSDVPDTAPAELASVQAATQPHRHQIGGAQQPPIAQPPVYHVPSIGQHGIVQPVDDDELDTEGQEADIVGH